ncbi:hypothetical protein NDU88_008326 [Pleurodeles waltl]|uniref:Uncharacterized protein n=1 Tax=Pleurodeles waltl TaxID=8319 RepID=A0AAV7RVF1_PLEWA|nr:hypothetical protein NDU88_008326 [Pleurodeles waltl]
MRALGAHWELQASNRGDTDTGWKRPVGLHSGPDRPGKTRFWCSLLHSAYSPPPGSRLSDGDSREDDSRPPNRLITSFYQKVGQKVNKALPLQQNTEQINEQKELEMQLGSQGAALEQEHELALVVLVMDYGGREYHGRYPERDSGSC